MTRLDDRLREGFRDAGDPAAAPDLGALTDEVTRRRHHRDVVRRVRTGALAMVVVVGTVGGYLALARAFDTDGTPVPAVRPYGSAGMVGTCDGGGGVPGMHVCRISADALARGASADDLIPLTSLEEEMVGNVSVSPDGRTILFDRLDPEGRRSSDLWRIGIDGTGESLVSEGSSDADWSPDGRRIVALVDGQGGTDPDTVVIIDANGEMHAAFTIGAGFLADPDWSPDGRTIALHGVDDDRPTIFNVPVAGAPVLPVDEGWSPAWSPDGTRLAYLDRRAAAVIVKDAEGGLRSFALPPSYIASHVEWSPDGQWVTVAADDDGADAIVAIQATSDPTTVATGLQTFAWIPADVVPSPEPSPDPPPTETSEPTVDGDDIGIGTNVCGMQRKVGLDILPGGERETAWTGYLVADDGTCPERRDEQQVWIVAVDTTADGIADTWTDFPSGNCPYTDCFPLDATDLDADGDGELIVTTGFSIRDQIYFAIEAGDGGASVGPILVASPGYAPMGIVPGEPLTTSSAGDAGYSSWIRCEGYPTSPIIVWTTSDAVIEGDDPTVWHEAKLQLQADGMFHVLDTTELSLPPGQDPGLIRSDEPACGVDFTAF